MGKMETINDDAAMTSSLTSFLVAIVVVLVTFLILRRIWDFRFFKRCNIIGPDPNFFLGNLKDIDNGDGTKAGFLALEAKYGKTFGIFFGSMPHIVTSDPEVLKQVFVKEFHHFANRQLGIIPPDPPADRILIAVHYERWKPIRSIMTPFFSGAKIRKMCPMLSKTVLAFVDIVNEKLAKSPNLELDLVPLYQRLALDALNLAAFGLNVNSQRENHYLMDAAVNLVESTNQASFKVFLCLIMQDLVPVIKMMDKVFNLTSPSQMVRACRKLLRKRKEELRSSSSSGASSAHEDVIKMMLDFEVESLNGDNDPTKGMTEDEIAMQVLVLIIGGFETTSRTLSYVSFYLAKYPKIQAQLNDEICRLIPANSTPNYDQLVNNELLEMVIHETLRLSPAAPFGVTSRIASRDCTLPNLLGEDLLIKKGVQISANMWALHFDPSVWPEPEKFDPYRWTRDAKADRDPIYFIPFGFGQRNCIGKRFALIELKMAVTEIVRHFEILPSPKSPSTLSPKMMDFGAKNEVRVILRKRPSRVVAAAEE